MAAPSVQVSNFRVQLEKVSGFEGLSNNGHCITLSAEPKADKSSDQPVTRVTCRRIRRETALYLTVEC